MQTRRTVHTPYSNFIETKPFNPFIILSSNDQNVLFFSQSFALLSGIPAMTLSISKSVIKEQNLELQHNAQYDCYEIHQFKGSNSSYFKSRWAQELIHEIRTASFIIDLGAHTIVIDKQLTPLIFEKIQRASRRQIISTLITSDFIQMVTSTPKICSISLTNILINSISNSPTVTQMKYHPNTTLVSNIIGIFDPFILGDFHFLSDFFSTILFWLETTPLTINMDILNDVSVQVSISISSNQNLMSFQGFSLIVHYLNYISAYFNSRSWVTQSSINIVFPLTSPIFRENSIMG